jgi:hypothetical protein
MLPKLLPRVKLQIGFLTVPRLAVTVEVQRTGEFSHRCFRGDEG